jgi:hypothetical protein
MANYELKFIDSIDNDDFIKVENIEDFICIKGVNDNTDFAIVLDKSTAIKFAKTLRTEINKITEMEVVDGRK